MNMYSLVELRQLKSDDAVARRAHKKGECPALERMDERGRWMPSLVTKPDQCLVEGDFYRVKPAPRYRPYTIEECLGLVGGRIRSKSDGRVYLVTSWGHTSGVSFNGHASWTGERLLRDFEHESGEPCGVKLD